MFSELAVKNVRRSVKDFGIWLLTIALGVCLFYVFNALETQTVMSYLARNSRKELVESIQALIGVLSVFVWAVLAFLILYASGFLIRRRKGELGIYLLLGMERHQVARLLLLETAVLGALALAAGLALGVLASQALSLFTAGLFAVPMTEYRFAVSAAALGRTAMAFVLIFFLVMVYHALAVCRCRLIDLFQAKRMNQHLKRRSLGWSVILFLAGAALLAVAYAMLLIRGLLRVDALFWVMIALGSLGTFLFFRSLSGFLLRLCRRSSILYYKGLNFFILRQFNARINTTYRSMTVICLMLLLAIGITASSVGLNDTVERMTDQEHPRDAELTVWPAREGDRLDLPAALAGEGFQLDRWCARWIAYPLCRDQDGKICLLQADYNAFTAEWGGEAGQALLEREQACVVPDRTPVEPLYWNFLADYAGDRQTAEEAFLRAVKTLPGEGGYSYTTKLSAWLDLMGTKVLVLFIGLYLGVVFLLASAAVLALQQLTQAADNIPRYQMLSRLGAPEGMRRRSVDVQVFLAFFLPLALALVHTAVGMTAANAVIAQVGEVDAGLSAAVAALLLVAVYGGYFLATCLGCRRLLRTGR